jgi:hypothetical protein
MLRQRGLSGPSRFLLLNSSVPLNQKKGLSKSIAIPAIVSDPSSPEGQAIQRIARVVARISGHLKVIFTNPYPSRESG